MPDHPFKNHPTPPADLHRGIGEPQQFFAVLEAARRNMEIKCGEYGHYTQLQRDDPAANEFRAYCHQEHGMVSFPLGTSREVAEHLVQQLNSAYNCGLAFAARHAADPRTPPVYVGKMGHINRQEELLP